MGDFEYSPIENIAYALQNIANTLKRIEKLMPVPGGDITGSQIWTGEPAPEVVEDSTIVEEVVATEETTTESD